jgi:hypothetical protein
MFVFAFGKVALLYSKFIIHKYSGHINKTVKSQTH